MGTGLWIKTGRLSGPSEPYLAVNYTGVARSGVGAPDNELGDPGDGYLNTINDDVYEKQGIVISGGGSGADGRPGPPGYSIDGDDGWPGPPGQTVTVVGPAGATIPGRDGEDAGPWSIPGRDGADGLPSVAIPGRDGEDAGPWVIPGRDGAAGLPSTIIPGRDGHDGDYAPIVPGKDGRPGGIRYIFNSSTLTNTDPGDGNFTLNNTPASSAYTVMSISRKNAEGLPIALLLQAALNSGTECILTFKSTDGSKIIQLIVLASTLVDNTTYYTVTVSPLAGSSSLGNGLEMYLDFSRSGTDAGFRFTFTTNTAATDPGAGKFQVDNIVWGAAHTVSFSNTDGRGVNVRAALRRLMNTGTQCLAQGFTRDGARQYPFLVLVTGFVDNGTYDTYGIQTITGAVPTNNDVVFFTFSKFGDQGLQGVSVGIPGRDGEDADPWPVPFAQSTSTFREVIGAKRTYYVLTGGSNNNTGLANTNAGAFATIQKAIDIVSTIDISTFGVDIQCGPGTFGQARVTAPWTGSGTVTLIGDAATPTNCVIDTTALGGSQNAACVIVENGGKLTVNGFKVLNSSGNPNVPLVVARAGGTLHLQSMNYGVGGRQIAASTGTVVVDNAYTVSAGANYHWFASLSGSIIVEGIVVTITGTPAFSAAWAFGGYNGAMVVDNNTYVGAATGKRYESTAGGGVAELSGNVNALPGNLAGTTGTAPALGWYA